MTTLWAEIDNTNTVLRVLVGSADVTEAEAWLNDNLGGQWIQTFQDGTRGHYAGIGFTYDEDLDAFIPPKQSEDATFDEETLTWIVPEVVEDETN